MKNKNALFLYCCTLITSFCLVYVGLRYFHIPLPKYYPTLNLWSTQKQAQGVPGMGWYGLLWTSLLGGGLISVLSLPIINATTKPGAKIEKLFPLATAITAASMLLMLTYYGHAEYSHWVLGK